MIKAFLSVSSASASHINDAVQREQCADVILARVLDLTAFPRQLAVVDAADLGVVQDLLGIMQGRGQYQRIRLGAERRIGVIAGVALHRVCQRLKQGQQAVALLVFRRCQVYEGVGLAQAVQLAAENLQVLTVRAVDLAHSDDLDLIPVVSRIGQDRGNGVAGGLCGGLGVVDRLGCIGGDGKVAVQRDRCNIDTFHRS